MTNTTTTERPTFRQVRLLAWLADPKGDFPGQDVIDYKKAFWSAAQIVEHTDIYTGPRARCACLRDLNALARLNKIRKWPNEATNRVLWQIGAWP